MVQYDVSPEQRKLMEERANRRLVLRNHFLKERTDPFKHGQGGSVFDPAFMRYQSLKLNTWEYFRPSLKNGLTGFCLVIVPMVVFGTAMYYQRYGMEQKYRNGEVAYKDRSFKFV